MKLYRDEQSLGCALFSLLLLLLGVGGWIANIVKLVHIGVDIHNIMFIIRLLGIVVAPLGAVLGYF